MGAKVFVGFRLVGLAGWGWGGVGGERRAVSVVVSLLRATLVHTLLQIQSLVGT